MIKNAIVSPLTAMLAVAQLDQIIADVELGGQGKLSAKKIREALKKVRGSLDLPSNHLTDQERADVIIENIQRAENPLIYSKTTFNQDFLSNHYLPHNIRLLVATYLWQTFGVRGNPIWGNYVNGTFKYIEPLDEDSENED